MRLAVHTWGSGPRAALLIHGIMSSHLIWRRFAPELAGRGYRVLAVDLRGHGASPRTAAYGPALFADDVVETMAAEAPDGLELAVGHSLGGLTLSLAAARLRPARAVYCDPAWSQADPERQARPADFRAWARSTPEQIARANPRWQQADLDAEAVTLAQWDPAVAGFLGGGSLRDYLPERPEVPSLVQLADPSDLTGPRDAALLERRGFEIRTVPGAGHCAMRDDYEGFLKGLDGWI